MKKEDNFFLVQEAEGSEKYNKFDRKRELLDYIAQRKETRSQGPIGRIITVRMIGEWEIEQVALLVPKVEDEKPKPGFRGDDGRTPCLDIRCLSGDRHYTDECPHKDEDINIPCEDKHCPVDGAHTAYQCHKIPRCHNPNCGGEQGTHWTKDCRWKDPLPPTRHVCINSKCGMGNAKRRMNCMKPNPFLNCPDFE